MAQKVTIDSLIAGLNKAGISQKQMDNISIILNAAWHAGLPPSYAIAMVVNSKAESGWDNDAFNPEDGIPNNNKGWGSLGLFQTLKTADGRIGAAQYLDLPPMVNGQPAANDPRRNPWTNAKLIIDEVKRYNKTVKWGGTSYAPSLQGAHDGGRIADVVSAFARHIERPADRTAKGVQREQMAFKLFPSWAGLPARELEWAAPYSKTFNGLGSIAAPALIAVALLAIAGGAWWAASNGRLNFLA